MRTFVTASSGGPEPSQAHGLRSIVQHPDGPTVTSDGSERGLTLRLLGLALVAAVLFLTAASSAFAARTYDSQLTEANGTAFSTPIGLAVDGSDNLWVSDTGTSLVSKFDSSGGFLAQNDGTGSWAGSPWIQDLAFGNGASLVYVVDSNFDDLWGLNLDTTYASVNLNDGLGGGCCFIRASVDNSGDANDGDIYVGGNGVVTRIDGSEAASNFSASASYISGNQITGTPDGAFGGVGDVAVDTNGDVYVADTGNLEVYRYDSTGTFVQEYSGSFGAISAVAVDPTSGNVLIGDSAQGVIHEFDAAGAFVDDTDGTGTPAGSINPQGLAVDSAGMVYVSDANTPVVNVFGAGGPPPVTHTVSVSATGLGTGTVTSSPAGIDCGATCSDDFNENSTVTLTATPASGSAFTGWTVDGDTNVCPGTGTCDVAIGTADHTVVANFDVIPQHTLTVSKTGLGAGSVTSSPAGIDCGATCADDFDENGTVTLTATPDAGSTFTGWTVDGDTNVCPGTGTCDVAIGTADHTVEANFDLLPQHTVTVAVTGDGSVSADSGAIAGCTEFVGICSGDYVEGSEVTLTATPGANQVFTGWSGDCSGTGDCVITVNADASVTATFEQATSTLTVSKAGTGGGTVTSSPAGIDCGATCADDFDEGSSVTLTATPATDSTFTGWSGGGCSGTGTCDVSIGASNATVTATFAQDKPTVTTTAGATGITQTAATVAGTVDPNSSNVTNCKIQYGTTTSYGSEAACSPANPGSGTTPVNVTASLSGLSAGTTYHFRVVATNAGGVTNGADQTFATLADTCATNAALCPPPPPPPPPPTCATDPSLCPPATPGVLKLDVAVAFVASGKAAVKLSCNGDTACSDTLKLTAKVKVRKGKKMVTKTVTLGKATVDVAAGASKTVKVTLNRTARKLLAKKPSLKATLTGTDLKHAIVLKGPKKKKK